jgi:small subunit ribosomal protein S3
MAVGETAGQARPRRVISAGGGRRRPEQGEPGEPETAPAPAAAETAGVEGPGAEAPEEAERPIVGVDPELERLLAEEEEIERRTRANHHETPHFPKDV